MGQYENTIKYYNYEKWYLFCSSVKLLGAQNWELFSSMDKCVYTFEWDSSCQHVACSRCFTLNNLLTSELISTGFYYNRLIMSRYFWLFVYFIPSWIITLSSILTNLILNEDCMDYFKWGLHGLVYDYSII